MRVEGGAFALTPRVLALGMAYVGAQGLWEVARPHLEELVGAHRRVVVDGPARRLRHRLRRPRLGAEDHRAARGDRHPLPGSPDLPGEGAARRPAARPGRGRRWPSRARPACRRTSDGAWSSCATSSPRCAPAGWALADEELAPGVRSIAVPVRDGAGRVRAAMNVTVHAAETSVDRCSTTTSPTCCAPPARSAPTGRSGRAARTPRSRGRRTPPPEPGGGASTVKRLLVRPGWSPHTFRSGGDSCRFGHPPFDLRRTTVTYGRGGRRPASCGPSAQDRPKNSGRQAVETVRQRARTRRPRAQAGRPGLTAWIHRVQAEPVTTRGAGPRPGPDGGRRESPRDPGRRRRGRRGGPRTSPGCAARARWRRCSVPAPSARAPAPAGR